MLTLGLRSSLGLQELDDVSLFVENAVKAFFYLDLITAVREFMAHATGSFGLGVTSSLDSDKQMVMAARGQTISLAFYPAAGLVLYGSEQAAVRARDQARPFTQVLNSNNRKHMTREQQNSR